MRHPGGGATARAATTRLGGGPLGEPWLDRPLRWLRRRGS